MSVVATKGATRPMAIGAGFTEGGGAATTGAGEEGRT